MKKPRIIMIAAISLDGKIARNDHEMTSWTSPEDKRFLHRELDRCDVVVVGRRTWEVARAPLSRRNCIVLTRSVKGMVQKGERLVYVNSSRGRLASALRKYARVCVLGGSEVYTYFLTHDLLHDIYLTVEPVVFGVGVPLFNAPVPSASYRLVSVHRLNGHSTVLMHYRKQ